MPSQPLSSADLKQKLLRMASQAEAAVNQAVKALLRRDDGLARQAGQADDVIDRLEMEVDQVVLKLLAQGPADEATLRELTTTMKVAHDLERVGDEATTISRRALALGLEPQLKQVEAIPLLASRALALLKEALDTFVHREPARARSLIPQDKEVDRLNRELFTELVRFMAQQPEAVPRCQNLIVISKSLERIGDHAKSIAEMVVFMCEGRDIRHGQSKVRSTPAL